MLGACCTEEYWGLMRNMCWDVTRSKSKQVGFDQIIYFTFGHIPKKNGDVALILFRNLWM